MDHTINSSLSMSARSPFSPRMQSKSMKTPLISTSLKKSSRFSVSGRSLQMAQVVLKTASYSVEKFGNTLPVIITEALTFSDRNSVVSVRISECGYAWLVCGRRLLVWQYRQNIIGGHGGVGTPQRKIMGGSSQCYELTLPQSDLAHRADLVSIFTCPGSHTPSCIAVSPEGVVRYWPNVSHEGVSVEVAAELQGQECDSVCSVGRLGCVLATTTCTVVLVQPRLTSGGRHSLNCHTLRTPQGWLGAIGKRMSSLIFGPMASEHCGETRLVRVLSVQQSGDQWWVFVLAGHILQKWLMSGSEPEQLLYVTELGRVIRDAFQCTAWEACGSDPTDIDLWLLDIQVVGNSVMLLAASVNLHVSPQVQYSLVRLDAEAIQTTAQIEEFLLLKLYGLYQEDNTAEFLSYRLLLCDNDIYIHRKRDITIVQPSSDPEVLDFISISDKLLGGSMCSNTPVFFSQNHGLVAVYPIDTAVQDMGRSYIDNADISISEPKLNDTSLMGNLTLYSLEPEDVFSAHRDTDSQFKAAFIFYIKNDQKSCQEILSELFPEEGEVKNEIDNVLDKVIIAISRELLNDVPAGDPRWIIDDKPIIGLGSSSAMQIHHQLQDKQQAHNLYLQFLKQSGLWTRIAAVTVKNSLLATLHILADHSELIVAAIALKNLMPVHGILLQEIIDDIFESESNRGLTSQDFFFKEVTEVQRGICSLVEKCELVSKSDENPIQLINLITESNNIIMNVLASVMQFRQQKADFFTPNDTVKKLQVKYIPWTFSPGKYCVYDALYKQQSLTLRYGARVTNEGSSRLCLYDQCVSIIDILLDARKCNVESMRNTVSFDTVLRQYQNERLKLIQPLVDDCEWEKAALLAEKYLDYTTLVNICENTNNQQRLDEYLERFKADDFAQHVFNWYLQENKQGKLLARCRASARPSSKSDLTKYLGTHPSLSWLQHVFEGNFEKVSYNLHCLASEETESLMKKKSMLSIAKLSSLVANDMNSQNQFVENINRNLEQIMYQEELPDAILSTFGYDAVRQPVLQAEELALLYICDEHIDVTEYDYMKAYEVSSYVVNDEQRLNLINRIWCSAILKDVWTPKDTTAPLEFLQKTLFYKFAELGITMGSSPDDILPPIETILDSSNLGELRDDRNFQYLIKLAYDYFYRSQECDEIGSM